MPRTRKTVSLSELTIVPVPGWEIHELMHRLHVARVSWVGVMTAAHHSHLTRDCIRLAAKNGQIRTWKAPSAGGIRPRWLYWLPDVLAYRDARERTGKPGRPKERRDEHGDIIKRKRR